MINIINPKKKFTEEQVENLVYKLVYQTFELPAQFKTDGEFDNNKFDIKFKNEIEKL